MATLEKKLHDAAEAGDSAQVAELLAEGADVNGGAGEYRGAALHWACYRGHAAVVRQLLDAGADLEARRDRWRRTPLHWACRGCAEPEVVRQLLDARANPAARNKDGFTPLTLAIREGRGIHSRIRF